MSLKRSFLSRRIIHRSFGISKSGRHRSESLTPGEEENNGGGTRRGRGGVVLAGGIEPGSWAGMPPELLGEIMERVEAGDESWPQRQNVVACACVCRRWRDAAREAVEKASLNQPGQFTFPSSLKKPGPRDFLFQCLIKRDKKNATFYLYLALSPSPSFTEKGKFLLAARRYRSGAHTEYIISLDSNDLSQGSKAYVGKLRSDFLGTNFTIYDSKPPHIGAKPSNTRASRRLANKQISPQIPSGIFQVGHVSYKFNFLKSRGPRRMVCSLTYPSVKKPEDPLDYIILNNKAPRWHEHLECWCLNFRGRVTVASVKNFQMVDIDQSGKGDEETVLLQFGKIGADTFTMDFREPLSAFQAFAICLTSFGTKLACE